MPKIISTHSFRGGTGKSNVTANLAVLVAKANYRVGVIDTDIQSPGIHVLFNFKQEPGCRCLTTICTSAARSKTRPTMFRPKRWAI